MTDLPHIGGLEEVRLFINQPTFNMSHPMRFNGEKFEVVERRYADAALAAADQRVGELEKQRDLGKHLLEVALGKLSRAERKLTRLHGKADKATSKLAEEERLGSAYRGAVKLIDHWQTKAEQADRECGRLRDRIRVLESGHLGRAEMDRDNWRRRAENAEYKFDVEHDALEQAEAMLRLAAEEYAHAEADTPGLTLGQTEASCAAEWLADLRRRATMSKSQVKRAEAQEGEA